MTNTGTDEAEIHALLDAWARATRQNRKDDVLANHLPDLVIYDVLPPMKYDSAAEYRKSWDQWQPDTQGEGIFELENLTVCAGSDAGFAYGFIHCGGTTPNGKPFEDRVRVTFCLRKIQGAWKVAHQHVSKPLG